MITNTMYNSRDVVSFLEVMNLYKNKAQDPYFNRNILNDYYSRKRHFNSVNVANLDVSFGQVLQLMENNYSSAALRSGHITDWREINNVNTALLDYNYTVTENGRYGKLMLHDHTETDNLALDSGDTIYQPGSEIINGKRVQRELYIWKEGKMERCDPNLSYFLPACYFKQKDEYVHLVRHLKKLNASLSNLSINYESDAVYSRLDDFIEFITTYLDIIRDTNDQFLCANIFRKIVVDGITTDAEFYFADGKFMLNEIAYEKDELVKLIILPFLLSASGSDREPAKTTIQSYPILHNSLLILFFALSYNFPMMHENKRKVFNTHFHWGAIGMAGYPPVKKGYFNTASKVVKKFHSYLIEKKASDGLFFVLIPVIPFLYYADRDECSDFVLLTDLFKAIKELESGTRSEMAVRVTEVAISWIKENKGGLSHYFLSKFKRKRSILFEGKISNRKLECPSFLLDMKYCDLSVVTGALFEFLGDDNS